MKPSQAPGLGRIYRPGTDDSRHFQASIFASPVRFAICRAAADALHERRFDVQVFEMKLRSKDRGAYVRAAENSSRIVIVDRGSNAQIVRDVAGALKRAGRAIPLLGLRLPRPTTQHVMEACIRNLE